MDTSAPPMLASDSVNLLKIEAGRVQSSGLLGEARARQLFDYLLANSLRGVAAKEVAIAMEVFGKASDYDASHDAVVRVYVHKLRRLLEDFYAARVALPLILSIPRGEYRLLITQRESPTPLQPAEVAGEPRRLHPGKPESPGFFRSQLAAGLVGAACMAVIACCAVQFMHAAGSATSLERLRATSLYSPLMQDARPLVVIVGDYYLIGETDRSMEVTRLVREFDVNSKEDLDRYIGQHPEYAERYMDVRERYLPTSTAFALRNVLPLLSGGPRPVQISRMSDVLPNTVKSADMVYIGYISGLGALQKLIFDSSRLGIGDSFDVLVDKSNGKAYYSQTATQALVAASNFGGTASYRDYGYFAAFDGPSGNHIVVFSGTRDEGVQQAAEFFTDLKKLEAIAGGLPKPPYEALLEVNALDGLNLSGNIVVQSNRNWPAS